MLEPLDNAVAGTSQGCGTPHSIIGFAGVAHKARARDALSASLPALPGRRRQKRLPLRQAQGLA
ncbi:MAG: hypothetical protein EGQ22_06655 [Senegalimassilia anaerobia]|nr:hypothetical protein [Senegalimassilia anaerobia]